MSVYEQIEIFGLAGIDAEFEIPNDDALQAGAVDAAFDGMCGVFCDSALASDLEPFIWGFVNLYHQRAERLARERGEMEIVIRDLIQQQDGSEIADVELQDAQTRYERTEERETAFILMREHAAGRYETETGRPWFPRSGSRTGPTGTAAMIDARDYMRAVKERKTEALAPEGSRVVIAGGQDFENTDAIFTALDRARDRVGDMVLLHGGSKKGCDHIAALWAKERGIPQVAFRPDFKAHNRAAPFKRNDDMLALDPRAVIVFPGNGITENVAQKAELKRVPVWRPMGDAAQARKDREAA